MARTAASLATRLRHAGERWLFRREDPLVLRRVALENLPAALRARLEPRP